MGYEKIRSVMEKSYKAVRVASDVETLSRLNDQVFVLDKLIEQRPRPLQCPRIDSGKTHHDIVVVLLTDELRSERKTSDAEIS